MLHEVIRRQVRHVYVELGYWNDMMECFPVLVDDVVGDLTASVVLHKGFGCSS